MKQRPAFPARLNTWAAADVVPRSPTHPKEMARGPVVATAKVLRKTSLMQRAAPVGVAVALEFAAVRRYMVEQLARHGVTDSAVLSAMGTVERHRFVDSALRTQAYEDTSLPIGFGQTISKPGVVARMAQLLRNGAEGKLGRVLEIGTGCGYQAAVLSLMASEVYSIERLRALHERARENLRTLRLANVHLLFGDGIAGYSKGAPYAAIIAAAGGSAVPVAWTDQLALGGRLVAPVAGVLGAANQQMILVIDKTRHGLQQMVCEAVHFVPLKSGVA